MSVIVGDALKKAVENKEIVVTPDDKCKVGAGSIDLTLGKEFRFFKKVTKVCDINDSATHSDCTRRIAADSVLVMPGELVHGVTREKLKLAKNICGRIEGRSRFARLGVGVHVTSGFIQPGTNAQQVLEIANFSPMAVRIHAGTKICQVVFERTEGEASYKGKFHKQSRP